MEAYTLDRHDDIVRELAQKVAEYHASHIPFRINHGSTNSTRRRDPSVPQLNIAHLNHILDIDTTANTVLVEPNVPLDALVLKTLKKQLVPLVVMEFPGITVGGGFSGASGESTGWKEGLFDCTVQEIEIILGNGKIMHAIKGGENSDLFNSARCSLGTMGVVTLLKVQLTQAQGAVRLSYQHTSSTEDTINRLAELCNHENTGFDFIEGLQYNENEGVIILGQHVCATAATVKDLPRQRFDRAIDPWFYMHARGTTDSHIEIVPIQSYLFRHNRGAFWSGEVFLKYYGLPNTRFVRWLFDPIMTARAIYKAMLAADSADGAIIQDLLLPVDTSNAFTEYVAEELKIWPLWICPIRKKAADGNVWGWPFYQTRKQTTVGDPSIRGELILNFGVWGPTDPTPSVVRKTNRDLEQKLRELRGMKVPYAANFYTEQEFWDLYDYKEYERLRKKWHAEALPDMYDKVRRKQDWGTEEGEVELGVRETTWKELILQIWPLGGLYQTFHVLFK
ncbi:FAD-binding domain-containing protein [Cucurbitaria berberidis CBS 394.84]|uniref:Delta(24)-sterol reductase n=1 Tax=Cucurbitaria berberidis CBS 394.84 TaxID=1168544 RepID=A0A9P4G9N6_9PLEO|nr:FAD-binding domain-containing protein [Cucurbitaria berberidis CBS 394.84]KAF1841437.1 FAD-binding domain-containing protein [Cucurbitaria berberidis CBS 394.84]